MIITEIGFCGKNQNAPIRTVLAQRRKLRLLCVYRSHRAPSSPRNEKKRRKDYKKKGKGTVREEGRREGKSGGRQSTMNIREGKKGL